MTTSFENELSVLVQGANDKYKWIDKALWDSDQRVLKFLINSNMASGVFPHLISIDVYIPPVPSASMVCFTAQQVRQLYHRSIIIIAFIKKLFP